MSSFLVPPEVFWGERLQIAREFKGLTQRELAADVSASPALISLCENGKKRDPSRDLVEACAERLKFRSGFFYRPLEDIFREDECSFRHRRSAPEKLKTTIRAHATLIGLVIAKLNAHLNFPSLNVPNIPSNSVDEIENAAESCRISWGLGIDAPLKQIGRVLEHAGVVIVPHVVSSAKIDAFSRHGRVTVIFLNKAIQSPSRWNFDIAHECGHLVIHRGIRTGSIETEQAADRFASAFLMPRRAFARDFCMASFSWPHMFELKRRWQTSVAAIVRRAYDIGVCGAVQYRRACQYISAKGWTHGEPGEPTFQEPELLSAAFQALGTNANFNLSQLTEELGFLPETFAEVTGIAIPESKPKGPEPLRFPRAV